MASLRRSCTTNIMCILAGGSRGPEAVDTIILLRRIDIRIDVYVIDHTIATGRFDITINSLADVKDVDTAGYGMLLLPGNLHYQRLEVDERVPSTLKDSMDQGKPVSTTCAAPTILGKQDYPKGRKYTYSTSTSEGFGGTYVNQCAVIDGTTITGRSAAAMIDFAFAIIEKLEERKKAEEVKVSVYY